MKSVLMRIRSAGETPPALDQGLTCIGRQVNIEKSQRLTQSRAPRSV
jgi:hypothetical protein